MGVITVVLYVVVVIVALLLIGLILIQQSKGGGFGASFGGIGESVFGAHAGSHLTKLTVVMTTLFFLLTLILAVIVGRRGTEQGISGLATEFESRSSKSEAAMPPETPAPTAGAPDAIPVSEAPQTQAGETTSLPVVSE